jgi:hypothetical protein
MLAAVTIGVAACGQDVETCDTACAIVRPPPTGYSVDGRDGEDGCLVECEANQASATAQGLGGNFQALLTCIGNAQSFSPLCYSLDCAVSAGFVLPPQGCRALDGGP